MDEELERLAYLYKGRKACGSQGTQLTLVCMEYRKVLDTIEGDDSQNCVNKIKEQNVMKIIRLFPLPHCP